MIYELLSWQNVLGGLGAIAFAVFMVWGLEKYVKKLEPIDSRRVTIFEKIAVSAVGILGLFTGLFYLFEISRVTIYLLNNKQIHGTHITVSLIILAVASFLIYSGIYLLNKRRLGND